jgi:osmotically-inducible protein OsmY
MRRHVLTIASVLALFTGFVLAQNPGTQNRPDQTQPDQSQPTPQAQPPQPQATPQGQPATPDTQAPASAQSQPQANSPGAQIQAALQKEAALANVMVNETSEKIELVGTVASAADKDKARTIAEQSAAGHKVVDNIKVSSNSNTSSPSSTTTPTTPPK